jgi:hypothetical protein
VAASFVIATTSPNSSITTTTVVYYIVTAIAAPDSSVTATTVAGSSVAVTTIVALFSAKINRDDAFIAATTRASIHQKASKEVFIKAARARHKKVTSSWTKKLRSPLSYEKTKVEVNASVDASVMKFFAQLKKSPPPVKSPKETIQTQLVNYPQNIQSSPRTIPSQPSKTKLILCKVQATCN